MPIFLILVLSTAFAVRVMMKKNSVSLKSTIDDLLQKEMKANTTRKKELDSDIYIYPSKNILPLKDYPPTDEYKKIIKLQKNVARKSELPMIKFKEQISNTELKLKYGRANLDTITIYEEHYNSYIRGISDWAKELIKLNNYTDAKIILEEAVNMKSDLTSTYILLTDVYIKSNMPQKINELKELVENSDMTLKDKVLNYISNLYSLH